MQNCRLLHLKRTVFSDVSSYHVYCSNADSVKLVADVFINISLYDCLSVCLYECVDPLWHGNPQLNYRPVAKLPTTRGTFFAEILCAQLHTV